MYANSSTAEAAAQGATPARTSQWRRPAAGRRRPRPASPRRRPGGGRGRPPRARSRARARARRRAPAPARRRSRQPEHARGVALDQARPALRRRRRAGRPGTRACASRWPGELGRPRSGTGARYGLSVSASSRSAGTRAAACCSSGRLRVGDVAGERQQVAALDRLIAAAAARRSSAARPAPARARASGTSRGRRRGCGSRAAGPARWRARSARRTLAAGRRGGALSR